MADVTRTGLNPVFGHCGVSRIHELERRASRMMSEAVEKAGDNRTVSVIRRVQTAPPDTSAGVAATWSLVAGLTGLTATVISPDWQDKDTQGRVRLREGERIVIVADVPAAGGTAADVLLLTDRILYDDPVYGDQEFDIKEALPSIGAGLVAVRVKYSRAKTS